MTELFIAKDAVISLLRIAASTAVIVMLVSIWRNELSSIARKGGNWVRKEAQLSRTKTGYVAAVLGRGSTLVGASTLVFAAFRPEYFASPAAQAAATVLAASSRS